MTDANNATVPVKNNGSARVALADIFRIGDQFHASAVLHFATGEKLFDDLQEPVDAAHIAQIRKWDVRKVEIFLNAMTAIGLIEKTNGFYRNTPAAGRALVTGSSDYIGGVIAHQKLQWLSWSQIGQVLSSDVPLSFQQERRLAQDPEANRAFNEAMIRLSRMFAGAVAALPDFQGKRFVLDLAGGHGSYLAAIAKTNPEVTGEIWDLATTEAFAAEVIRANGLTDRLKFRVRDLMAPASFDVGPVADVVMLNDCLHYFDRESVLEIVRNATRLLRKHGTLILLSMKLDRDGTTPAHGADFSLHMMLNTVNGGLHSTDFLVSAMENQGMKVETVDLYRYALLVGRPHNF